MINYIERRSHKRRPTHVEVKVRDAGFTEHSVTTMVALLIMTYLRYGKQMESRIHCGSREGKCTEQEKAK